ncbi:MAG: radical SAM protein [Rhodospirillales bacterium]|jgi:MoaA/NifB/PqqE/SkfB family radical SAM enzyme
MKPGTFAGYLSADFPSQINMDITEFCNLACIHCPYEAVTKIKGKARRHLDVALHHKLIDEIAEIGLPACQFIRYTGDGEPLLHPDHAELLGYAVKRTGLPVNLTTNGLLLDERRARILVDHGVSVFDISLDAHLPETYAKVRVGGDLNLARANVLRLIELAGKAAHAPKVMVSFVRQPLNDGEAEAFQTFWEQAGADFVVIRRQHSCAGSMAEMAKTMWAAAGARTPCLYPWERLVIKPDGKFSFCPADWLHQAELGDIATSTVAEVWTGPAMAALRQAHCDNDYGDFPFCAQCPDWSAIRWPSEGRSYATVMREFKERKTSGGKGE